MIHILDYSRWGLFHKTFNGARILQNDDEHNYLSEPESQLASAIIVQALEDYKDVCQGKYPRAMPKYHVKPETKIKRLREMKKEIEDFFKSDYFHNICVIDIELVLNEVEMIRRRSII